MSWRNVSAPRPGGVFHSAGALATETLLEVPMTDAINITDEVRILKLSPEELEAEALALKATNCAECVQAELASPVPPSPGNEATGPTRFSRASQHQGRHPARDFLNALGFGPLRHAAAGLFFSRRLLTQR